MKKVKKLTLSRETLHTLAEGLLQVPRGGASMQPQSCITCGSGCVETTVVTRTGC